MTFAYFDICHPMASLKKIVLRDLELLFEGKKFKRWYLKRWELMQKRVATFKHFDNMPWNGVIAKILLRDLDLLFEVEYLNR